MAGHGKAAIQSACPMLVLAGGEDMKNCVPARRRRQLRRAIAAAERKGQLSFECMAPDGVEAFLDMLFRLHAARWHERGEPGILHDPLVQAFHRAALPLLARAGLARCTILTIGGEIDIVPATVDGVYTGQINVTVDY